MSSGVVAVEISAVPGASVLRGLFGNAVATHEAAYPAEFPPLLPDEQLHTGSMSEKRLLEFCAGRFCARAALASLGMRPEPVGRGTDRAPIWPAGVTGSITHVSGREHGFAAAAVARSSELRAVGLDAELDVPLDDDLHAIVLTPSERARLEAAAPSERTFLAKLSFSAKEAVYKCQYTLTREFLEFTDVEVESDLSQSTFRATFMRPIAGVFPRGSSLTGRFTRQQGLIVTGVELR